MGEVRAKRLRDAGVKAARVIRELVEVGQSRYYAELRERNHSSHDHGHDHAHHAHGPHDVRVKAYSLVFDEPKPIPYDAATHGVISVDFKSMTSVPRWSAMT